ncbi:phospholipase D-like domain-containing protein [Niveibacterium sp. SC-1]|uniref:phospholipase D-like domain-containing protein n=1 Tax=Niveibacterium sp. SC-1 TaxID=3135646 RepID=UPI00311E20DB
MSQIHLTMHSVVFGEHGLVNGVRRATLTDRIRRQKEISWAQAAAEVNDMRLERIVESARHDWKRFVTLLDLRNWDHIGGMPVTEQIYVHSKLLIADDQVAVLGSANINDRSMLGDRDSELATVITSRNAVHVPLAGPMQSVAKEVHELRVGLWKKHFGAGAPGRQAGALLKDAVLRSPGVPATWEAIQRQSNENARLYNDAFWYIPRSEARHEVQPKEPQDRQPGRAPASIWPTWKYQTYLDHGKGGKLQYHMPFDPLFWRAPEYKEVSNSWSAAPNATAPVAAPQGVQGFIVALPTEWTRGEDNLFSKSHIATIAANEVPASDKALAANEHRSAKESTV